MPAQGTLVHALPAGVAEEKGDGPRETDEREEVDALFKSLELEWVDVGEGELRGSAATDIDAVEGLIDRMKLNFATLVVPDKLIAGATRRYTWARSEYGEHDLFCDVTFAEAEGAGELDEAPPASPPHASPKSPMNTPGTEQAPTIVIDDTSSSSSDDEALYAAVKRARAARGHAA